MVETVTTPAPRHRVGASLALGVAVSVAGLEAAGLVAFALVVVVRGSRGDASSASNVALLCGLLLAWAAGLGVAARGLRAGRRWARAPLVVTELLAGALSVSMIQGGVGWVGWPLLACSVAALAALFAPAMTELLGQV